MQTSELTMLLIGLGCGANIMNALHAHWNSKAARRNATAAQVAAKRVAGDRYLASLTTYRIINRSAQ
ncbi:hypothetical protein ACN2WE_21355 [Streptomyces sp. cg28]|uniref:hypothetical protein n=1 Tax=Streptomyces sp. cg28 TaxID=3403457 RepID=UPI003B20EA1E